MDTGGERTTTPIFGIGEIVCLRADPDRSGPIIEILPPTGGEARYSVFHSAGEIRQYHEQQLVLFDDRGHIAPLSTLLASDAGILNAAMFRARLTAARLNHPQIDHLYSLHAARIRFVPFQLKPLLRFLRSDRPRLLIADEVGVGKTIEAGLILRELQAREEVGNVLIVCPKALVTKWRAEMLRFDEDFQPLIGETLRYCLREAHLDGVWPQRFSRAIVPLELLRTESHLVGDLNGRTVKPGLLNLDPPPHFSLMIVDEAHHLRNPETRSHDLARFLCDVSEAVLFLSATPVHLGSKNLFVLLNLLRPDLFMDEGVFNAMLEPNRDLNAAMSLIRHSPSDQRWQADAAQALSRAADTEWGYRTLNSDRRFTTWLSRLKFHAQLADVERVECLRDLEEVHTLAHVMSRTRRRDIGRFTIREPHTVSVPFTPEQENFYRSLIDFRREMLLQIHDPIVVRLIIDTLERQASSCLPALIPLLDRFFRTGRFSGTDITDDVELSDLSPTLPPLLQQQASDLRRIGIALPKEDPKLERMLDIAATTRAGNGPGKLLVFSYFLHTLAYLHENLSDAGFRTARITGQTHDEEREALRNRFRLPRAHPDAVDILLSSEVGCEGLDYEFCDRLVNYDIPWNPMRIEQRIGRIDRFGQASEKVLIYNFITPGTVEERIFFRCFERIGIFRDTVGELEEILGETVQDLTRAALDPRLTPEQADEIAQQTSDNLIRLAEEQRRLEDESAGLLGLERVFGDEVDELIAEGRFVAPSDLAQMIELYLDQPDLGGRLAPDTDDRRLFRLRLNREGRQLLARTLRDGEARDRTTAAFLRWLDADDPYLLLTFDQELALEQRDLTFVTPIHPLTRLAVQRWAADHTPLVSRLRITTKAVLPGTYLFTCDLWETIALRAGVQLVSHVWSIDRAEPDDEVASQLLRLLSQAHVDSLPAAPETSLLNEELHELDEIAHRQRLIALGRLREDNGAIAAQRLASLSSYYTNRIDRLQRDLTSVRDSRIMRMRRAELARARHEFVLRRQDIEDRRDAEIVSQRLATGILFVRAS